MQLSHQNMLIRKHSIVITIILHYGRNFWLGTIRQTRKCWRGSQLPQSHCFSLFCVLFVKQDFLLAMICWPFGSQLPDSIFPTFINTRSFVQILAGGASACSLLQLEIQAIGVLVKLRQWGFRTLLQSIHLANLRSLPNKIDELLFIKRMNSDFSCSAALCFTEMWLSQCIMDSAIHQVEHVVWVMHYNTWPTR